MHPLHPVYSLAKLCVFPAAPAYAAGMLGNLRPTVGGPWAATLAELPPETIFNEHYVWLAVVVMVLAVLGLLALLKVKDAVVREIKGALASEDRKPAVKVEQPLVIQHADQVVRVEHLEPVLLRLKEHEEDIIELKTGLKELVAKGDERGKEIGAKIEAQGLETGRRVGVVHNRVDNLAKEVGHLSGLITGQAELLRQMSSALLSPRKPH